MTADTGISAVGVVLPAHNERRLIGAALTAVLRAVESLPEAVALAVVLVLDRCTDGTERAVSEVLDAATGRGASATEIIYPGTHLPIGVLRNLGLYHALRRLDPVAPPHRTWLLSTDADSTVPTDWAGEHLRMADRDFDAVTGLVDLDTPHLLPRPVRDRYARLVGTAPPNGQAHLYAANLGVRASAFLEVGGFPEVSTGEDHGLAARLRAGRHRMTSSTTIRVRTSARLDGRAEDGLAGLLRGLHAGTP